MLYPNKLDIVAKQVGDRRMIAVLVRVECKITSAGGGGRNMTARRLALGKRENGEIIIDARVLWELLGSRCRYEDFCHRHGCRNDAIPFRQAWDLVIHARCIDCDLCSPTFQVHEFSAQGL